MRLLLFLLFSVLVIGNPCYQAQANPNSAPLFGPTQYDNIARKMADISFASDLPYVFNNDVKSQLAEYYYNNPKFVPIAIARGKNVFPAVEKQFQRLDIPEELKYVAVLESLLNSKARSKAGAVGMWQLMESTANDFNLHMGQHIDERKDVRKSTRAAGIFLKRLYKKYDDWFLALAAYNYGPGNLNKILKRNPHATTFWEIKHLLPKETREYVPKFIAISYLMEYSDDYEFQKLKTKRKVRKPVAKKKPNRIANLAKLSLRDIDAVESEFDEIPYCIRLFPIPVSNSLNQDEQIPFDDSDFYIMAADLDAILKFSGEEESDFPSTPLPQKSDEYGMEALLGTRKNSIGPIGLELITV